MIGGYRRWFSEEPPGKSSGRLRQKLLPACTSLTPSSTFSDVMRLIRPSSSSSPQSPHVEPSGRCTHRFATADLLTTLYRPVIIKLAGARAETPAQGSGTREGGPPGGDHEWELAREEIGFVCPGPGVGLGGGASPHRGDVVEPGDGQAIVGRRPR